VTIICDTREQRPWAFPDGVDVRVGTIRQGDYALDGDNTFSIERKSVNDLIGTIFSGWDRFQRELRRMDDCGFATKVIIVEGDFDACCYLATERGIREPQHDHPKIGPEELCGRLAELIVRHRCCVLFARDEGTAAAMAFHIFCKRMGQLNGKVV